MKTMKTITIEIPDGKRAEWVNGVLTLIDYKPKDITDRIKTFEDAYKWCKENGKHALIEQYNDGLNVGLQRSPDIIAYLKLRIITCALNEGWKPTFERGELRWSIGTVSRMSEGRSCSSSHIVSYTEAAMLLFKSEKLAEYAAKKFKNIYMDFCHKGKE